MPTVKSYFDNQGHQHVYHNDPDIYKFIIQFVERKSQGNTNINVLDFGCGDGSFMKSLINSKIDAVFYGTDVSDRMIYLAKSNIKSKNVHLIISDGFNMPFSENLKFDLIHLDCVLHHLIGKSIPESKKLVTMVLKILISKLKKDGILILEDLYYDSYLYPSLTSIIVFYGLKISNFFNIDIGKLIQEYHKGLEVRFLHSNEIFEILKDYGDPTLIKSIPWPIPTSYKIFLLKKLGRVTYTITK